MRSIASLPSSNSLLRNIALSIAIVHILGCKITAFSPNINDNCHKINEKDEAISRFLQWVLENGTKYNHQYGCTQWRGTDWSLSDCEE
jgi:hypothetical protein